MTRGEIYRTAERVPERGDKPGFYVVVSRPFIAENDVASLPPRKLAELNRALAVALDLD